MIGRQGPVQRMAMTASVVLAVAGGAASAHAQTTAAPGPAIATALRQALGVSGQSSPLPLSFGQDRAPLTPGVAQTAVDHRFGKGGVVGSAGFLCGRGAGPDNNGAATAYGYDPEGRFVGAKLSFAFK